MKGSLNLDKFQRISTDNRDIQRLQDSLESSLSFVGSCPLIDGLLLEDVKLKEGDNSISHGLGRELRGWIITRQSQVSSIYDKQASNPTKDKFLTLSSSTSPDVTVDLWVF